MERRRWCRLTAWGGGAASAVGVVLFALFSDAGGSCTANVIVLGNGVIGPHGCAATSIAYHAGIGLMVLGAALLIGACMLAVLPRAESASAVGGRALPDRTLAAGHQNGVAGRENGVAAGHQNGVAGRENGVAAGHQNGVAAPVGLPPGWYGNPSNRGGAVQWWDGHRLVDPPPRTDGEPGRSDAAGRGRAG